VGQGLVGLFINSHSDASSGASKPNSERIGLPPSACWPVQALAAKEEQLVQNVEGSLDRPIVFQRFRGLLPTRRRLLLDGTGLFALARTFNGTGRSEKPRVYPSTPATVSQERSGAVNAKVKEILKNTLTKLRPL